jgi:hypothetical protein
MLLKPSDDAYRLGAHYTMDWLPSSAVKATVRSESSALKLAVGGNLT